MCSAFVCVGHMAAYEFYGHMAELVDAPVSGTGGATHGSSSLLMPTTLRQRFGWQATVRQGFGWQAFVFASGKAVIIKSSGVVAQLIERYVRIVEVVGLSPISSTILRQGFVAGHCLLVAGHQKIGKKNIKSPGDMAEW